MPLPTGTWRLNINGVTGDLVIGSIDPTTGIVQGNLGATFGGMRVVGSWNEVVQCLGFTLETVSAEGFPLNLPQVFRAVLFSTPMVPQAGQDIVWTLVGTTSDPGRRVGVGINTTGRQQEFGWFAQFTQVL
jgi:hypothetical protein